MIQFLQGKKTFILSAIAIIYAVSAYLTGNIDVATMIQLLTVALGLSTVRSGVSAEIAKIAPKG